MKDFNISISAPLIISKVRRSTERVAPVEACFKVVKDRIKFVSQRKERRKRKKHKNK